MDVQLPDGTLLQNVPDGTTQADITAKLGADHPSLQTAAPSQSGNGFNNLPMNSLQDYGKAVYGWKDYKNRMTLLPVAEDEKGDIHVAMPQAGVDVLNNLLLPGYAAKGGQYNSQDVLGLAGMISPMSPAARVGEYTPSFLAPGSKSAKPVTPTTQELKTAASSGYDVARDMGVTYSSDAVKNMASGIESSLNQEGRIGELNPETFALLKKLQNPPDDSFVTLDSLQALRRRFGDVAGSPDPAKSAAASIAINKLDDFLERGGMDQFAQAPLLAGSPSAEGTAAQQAAGILKAARGNSAAAFRANDIADLSDKAQLRAAAANSGRNIGNTLRQRLASLLSSNTGTRGYSPEEIAAMEKVVEGTPTTNTLRSVSNKLGGGGGAAQTLIGALGAGLGSHFGTEGAMVGAAIPTVVGTGARSMANTLTKRSLGQIEDMIRQRSPLYASRVANPGSVPTFPVESDLARRLALALHSYPQNTGENQ